MILAVVLANAVIGFIQEGKAEAAMAAIRGMLAPRAAVLRDGQRVTVDGADLVGDLVLLEAGDKVPADLRPRGKGTGGPGGDPDWRVRAGGKDRGAGGG